MSSPFIYVVDIVKFNLYSYLRVLEEIIRTLLRGAQSRIGSRTNPKLTN